LKSIKKLEKQLEEAKREKALQDIWLHVWDTILLETANRIYETTIDRITRDKRDWSIEFSCSNGDEYTFDKKKLSFTPREFAVYNCR
jgi:hypothetical protein